MMSPMRLELTDDGTRWKRDDRLDRILALRSQGCPDPQIWVSLGLSRATFFRLLSQGRETRETGLSVEKG